MVATDPTNAWIVGTLEPTNGQHTTALFEHWDGQAWSRVLAPPTPGTDPSLNALAARNPQDIWAAGATRSDFHPYTQPLVMHWDGSRWSLATTPHFHIPPPVGSPDPQWASAGFFGLAIQPGGRPWAVGIMPSGTGDQERPLVAASCRKTSA